MKIPKVRIARTGDGWLGTCVCGWQMWQVRRPVVDAEAVKHQAKCAQEAGR